MNRYKNINRLKKVLKNQEHLIYIIYRIEQANLQLKNHKPTPRLFQFAKKLLEANEGFLTYEHLEYALLEEQEKNPFSYSEFFMLNDTIVWEIYNRFIQFKDKYLEAHLKTLKFLEEYSFDSFFQKHSYPERVLLEAENGVFLQSDSITRNAYRNQIIRYAKKQQISEVEAAKRLSNQLTTEMPHPLAKALYFPLLFSLSFLGCFLTYLFCKSIWVSTLLFFPIFIIIQQILHYFYGKFISVIPLPKLELQRIPEHAKTLVVITTLLFGKEKDNLLFDRLESFWLKNTDPNAMFGLLADLSDSNRATSSDDLATLKHAKEKIKELNDRYGNHFCLFIRHRTYNEKESCFMGYERKRGAVLELCRAAKQGSHSFFEQELPLDFLKEAKYLITLDADTDLSMGAVCHLVATMLHPQNRPIIENGIVKQGYAVLQPRMEPSLATSGNSPFSVLQCGSGGTNIYANASFDLYQCLFGEGIFCGKGIIDISCYYELLDKAFPENIILSHDLLEGAYLRAGNLVNFSLTDSCPKTPIADFKRLHRWMRGDLQSLAFAGRRVRTFSKEKRKNPISALSKWKLFDNFRRMITPILSAFLMISAIFLSLPCAISILGIIFLQYTTPFLLTLWDCAKNANRRFFSHVLSGIWHSLLYALYQITILFAQASLSIDALFRTIFRVCISKKKRLEWTTALESDRTTFSFSAYLTQFASSFFAGFLILAFSPHEILHIIGLLWCLSPFVAYFISRPFKQNSELLSVKEKKVLSHYVATMWQYFSDFVTEENHNLPPDNYQISPTEIVATRTSPTNIGLYLLSVLVARDFNIISTQEMRQRIEKTMETLQNLPHWHGHLYNWYDTKTLELLGTPYISTVDSGNFITSLLILSEGILEYAFEENALYDISEQIKTMIERADFSFLYDSQKHLMTIGYNTVTESHGENHYDFYMSEARTTSYYAIAKGMVEKEHWQYLRRPLIAKNQFLGLQSWSGTMFEYFMPTLFLPTYKNSLPSEALYFAYAIQATATTKGIFGRSESGYFHFDAALNYQYRAFGVQELALEANQNKENVIAPYASFLALSISPGAVLDNLASLAKIGAFGKYGFYEAIDFTPSRVGGGFAIIRSFMSHHIGMSMIACANSVFDHIFVKRFLKDPHMNAATELLMEKIPVDAPIYRQKQKIPFPSIQSGLQTLPAYQSDFHSTQPICSLITNGKMRLIASSYGEIGIEYKNLSLLFHNLNEKNPLHGFRFLVECDGKIFDLLKGNFIDYGSYCQYLVQKESISFCTSFSILGDLPCACLHFEAKGKFKKITPTLFFEPIMAKNSDYFAHPAFSKLSIEADYDSDRRLLSFHRRKRAREDQDFYLSVTFLQNTAFEFCTRRDNLLRLCYTEEDLLLLPKQSFAKETGACIDPVCAIKKSSETEKGQYSCDLLIFFSHKKEDVYDLLSILRCKESGIGKRFSFFDFAQRSLSVWITNTINASRIKEEQIKYIRLLLTAIYRPANPKISNTISTINDIWQFGISGDLPIILLSLQNDISKHMNLSVILQGFFCAQRFLALSGIRFDLILLCKETDPYLLNCQNGLKNLIEEYGAGLFLNKQGGIYLLDQEQAPQYLYAHALFSASINEYTVYDHLFFQYQQESKREKENSICTSVFSPHPADDSFLKSDASVYGATLEADSIIIYKGSQKAPWSYLYTGKEFGTLVTQNSLGYTWWHNAREGRLTTFSNDPLTDLTGERLLLKGQERDYDLCACANTVTYYKGNARYEGILENNLPYTIEVGIDPVLHVKLIRCKCKQKENIIFKTNIILGTDEKDGRTVFEKRNTNTTFYRNYCNLLFINATAYITQFDDEEYRCFLFGIYTDQESSLFDIVWEKYHFAKSFSFAFERYAQEAQKLCMQMTVETENPIFDRVINFHLPYQALYARLMARSGFYQSGGAFGFRDQLQDSLAALFCDSSITKTQILLSASRQFIEGDVLHWWHEEPYLRGIRTKCSDDLLWLPYVVAIYCETVDSYEILKEKIFYVEAPQLSQNEQERYGPVGRSNLSESLYSHCIRAIEKSCQFGRHGLPLIGSGDWNDGMNRIGEKGEGESVWLAFFLQLVLDKMIPICLRENDEKSAQKYRALFHHLSDNIERYAYDTDHYLRAFFDDGTPLGKKGSSYCQIDLLPQAFSAIVNGKNLHTQTAMYKAYHKLFEQEGMLLRLFTPPVPASEEKVGYISGYVDGVRENGGQYTHAAIWAAWGFYSLKENETAWNILKMIHPALRAKKDHTGNYRTEPYSIPADIYASPSHMGRGGWTHYTGSAAWYYRIFFTQTVGYSERGNQFTISPALCKGLPEIKVTIRRHDTVYRIHARLGKKGSLHLDGKEAKFPMFFDKKSHFLEIVVENSSDLL